MSGRTRVSDLPIEVRKELIEKAGLKSWPVRIRVNRTPTTFGITAAHDHTDGSLVTFMYVGGPLSIDDRLVENEDGDPEIVPGVATIVLQVVADATLKVVA